jgi:Uma2 family endonuclease
MYYIAMAGATLKAVSQGDAMVLAQNPNQQDVDDAELPAMPPCDLYSDEPPLESYLHLQQLLLLIKCLDWLWQDRDDYFAAGNLTIYYSSQKIKTRDFKGPDFFVVLGTEQRPRKSWTVWEEGGKYPNLIIELLSDSTANVDRVAKKQLYQDTFRTLEYFWFSPDTLEFEGYGLLEGLYQPIAPQASGLLWSSQLNLFLGVHDRQLRYFSPAGELIPTPEESARTAEQKATYAEYRVDVMAAKLRELGIDPDTLK